MNVDESINSLISGKGIKGYLKRIMFGKIHNCLLSFADEQQRMIDEYKRLIDDKQIQLNEQQKQLNVYEKIFTKIQSDLAATSRQTMLAKWKIIDSQLSLVESDDDILECKICNSKHLRREYETKISECIFNGGKLIRYVCPDCGVIFGPTKFVSQGQQGIDEDYWVHYLGYSEGDSTYKEERAFFMLNPDKDKVYLNYGCGKWTKSLQKLRGMGYQVYGYEPYAFEIDNPYLITDKKDLLSMRFDGIYSNDVLEHFITPVDDMKFMKNLLKNKESKMSHCTSCYEYKYEYTRFHTHFFVGNAVNVMAKKAGLEIIEKCNDIEKNDFYCCVYKPLTFERTNLIQYMSITENVSIIDGKAHMRKDGILFGPYVKLLKGKYNIHFEIGGCPVNSVAKITSNKGRVCHVGQNILSGDNVLKLYIEEQLDDVEFVVLSNDDGFTINRIWYEIV